MVVLSSFISYIYLVLLFKSLFGESLVLNIENSIEIDISGGNLSKYGPNKSR